MRILLISIIVAVHTLGFGQNVLVENVGEFNSAVASSSAGDTIFLKNGVWEDDWLRFYSEGEENNPVVLAAENEGKVTLTGTSRLSIYGKYLEVHGLNFKNGYSTEGKAIVEFRKSSSELAENCRLTNSKILNYNPDSDEVNYKWISIYGKNNRVDHCQFEGKNHEGTLLVVWLTGEANYHQIDHNYFANIPVLGRNGGETIRIGTSTNSMTDSRTIVENNVFEACDGEIEIISNKSCFNIYRYNTFLNNDGMLTLRHGNDCEVYGNFFYGNSKSSGGVRIIGERHKVYNNYFHGLKGSGFRAAISMVNGVPDSPLNRYFQVKNALVVNNTIVSCKEPVHIGSGKSDELSLAPLDCILANNVITETTGSASFVFSDDPTNISYISNVVYDDNQGLSHDGIVNQNPDLELVDSLWRLSENSPLIDGSDSTFTFVTHDIDGQSRTGNPDLGCDEVSSDPIQITPLSKSDVGLDWVDSEPDPEPEPEPEEPEEPTITSSDFVPEINFHIAIDRSKISIIENKPSNARYRLLLHDMTGKLLISKIMLGNVSSAAIGHLNGLYIVTVENLNNGKQLTKKILIK